MSEMGFENVFYLENFECTEDEVVLVESSPPASPAMAARLAQPTQVMCSEQTGEGGTSPTPAVRDLIVIPEIPNVHIHHHVHQVSSTVVEVNGDNSSGHSSPTTEGQHTFITVASRVSNGWMEQNLHVKLERTSDEESEGGNGVNSYHVQYVEPQEIYTQGHQAHSMETLRSYPVYGVTTVGNTTTTEGTSTDNGWGGASSAEYTAYGVVVAADEAEAPASPATPGAAQPPRMPPATVQWLLDHYETAEGVSIPRSTLYAHYLRHCNTHRLDPVNAASFGKLIRSVFIGLRTRRLGTRGNSKYHYYGIRAKPNAGSPPQRHDSMEDKTDVAESQDENRDRDQDQSPVGASSIAHRQYLGSVQAPEPPELEFDEYPEGVTAVTVETLRRYHREHGMEFLEAVAALDTSGVELARRALWRRGAGGAGAAGRRALQAALGSERGAAWLRRADLRLYQRAAQLLLPDVLHTIPPHLTQSIRNFAKSVESALAAGGAGLPPPAARAAGAAAGALAAALRRYTSLNHLAQAARAVLNNHHQIHQMLADLNRVDFRVVREQAAWACSCGSGAASHRLEADFKATLGRGASLEQWAAWLERCVDAALQPLDRRAQYETRARRLLLDWSFYSSLVIRELTLRSAASFGSFHLIRLLYDEYVSYLIEQRIAAHCDEPPIAVMYKPLEEDEEVSSDKSRDDNGEADPDDPDGWEWEDDDDDDLVTKKPRLD